MIHRDFDRLLRIERYAYWRLYDSRSPSPLWWRLYGACAEALFTHPDYMLRAGR